MNKQEVRDYINDNYQMFKNIALSFAKDKVKSDALVSEVVIEMLTSDLAKVRNMKVYVYVIFRNQYYGKNSNFNKAYPKYSELSINTK